VARTQVVCCGRSRIWMLIRRWLQVSAIRHPGQCGLQTIDTDMGAEMVMIRGAGLRTDAWADGGIEVPRALPRRQCQLLHRLWAIDRQRSRRAPSICDKPACGARIVRIQSLTAAAIPPVVKPTGGLVRRRRARPPGRPVRRFGDHISRGCMDYEGCSRGSMASCPTVSVWLYAGVVGERCGRPHRQTTNVIRLNQERADLACHFESGGPRYT
jgi:hypothetical protein